MSSLECAVAMGIAAQVACLDHGDCAKKLVVGAVNLLNLEMQGSPR